MNKRATFKSVWLPIMLAMPQLLLIFFFFYWPAISVFSWAFTLEPAFGGAGERLFVGFDNFREVFTDRFYWKSVGTSLIFSITATALSLFVSLVLAVCVDRQMRGSELFRFFYIWPYAIAAPAAGLAFSFIFAPQSGLLAFLNDWSPNLWNPATKGSDAMILIIVTFAWKWIGYNFIFLIAGLQSIPRSLIEAAAMDGSGPVRRAIDLQIPLLAPTLFFLLVLNLTESFVGSDTFGIVDMTTEGGPAKATEVLVYRIVNEAFQGLNYSGAAAQSLLLIGLIMLFTFIQFRYVERRVHYK